jgi:hypothetical protein
MKDWIMGKRAFILAVLMLILAFLLHMLSFLGLSLPLQPTSLFSFLMPA